MNVTANSPPSAGFVVGLPKSCVTNLIIENVKLTVTKGLTLRNAHAVEFKNPEI